ncbi:MAG: 50S ribosome-binding GTPase [Selenomonadaceae bacterium]|nr:50S ribosome-binding GTPase [Selenomonadaceae bacterium]
MEEFKLVKFTKEGAKLLREVTDEFKHLKIDASRLPKNFSDDGSKIKLVFIGQYGAGKSSIIKMLTGEEVAIGAAITTQNFTPYEWNGLEIIDTPGIHTLLRPDHDEITYEQINHAALLIFVVTNEGFSQRMGDHFRTLAIKQKRAANMVLVVNKMDRTALGNVPEQQEVIYEDLKKVTKPHDPKNLYLSFLDTAAYFEALDEEDKEIKAELFELSGHDIFVENLNRFVAEKGVLQKINLPLNTIAAEIRNASLGLSDEAKADLEAYIKTVRKRKEIFVDGKNNCLAEVEELVESFKSALKRYGLEVAEEVLDQKSEEAAKKIMNGADERVKKIAAEYAAQIDTCTKNFIAKTEADIKAYESSDFVKQVNANLQKRFAAQGDGSGNGIAQAVGGGGVAAGALLAGQGAQFFAQFAIPAITPLGHFVGTAVNVGVRVAFADELGLFTGFIANQAGNFVKSLPFFQAELTAGQRVASFIAGNAKILGAGLAVAGTFFSLWQTYRDGEKAEERERQRRAAREDITSDFNEAAEKIGKKMLDTVNQWLKEKVDPVIASTFDDKIKAVEAQMANEKIKSAKLSELLKRTENLIGAIQKA